MNNVVGGIVETRHGNRVLPTGGDAYIQHHPQANLGVMSRVILVNFSMHLKSLAVEFAVKDMQQWNQRLNQGLAATSAALPGR